MARWVSGGKIRRSTANKTIKICFKLSLTSKWMHICGCSKHISFFLCREICITVVIGGFFWCVAFNVTNRIVPGSLERWRYVFLLRLLLQSLSNPIAENCRWKENYLLEKQHAHHYIKHWHIQPIIMLDSIDSHNHCRILCWVGHPRHLLHLHRVPANLMACWWGILDAEAEFWLTLVKMLM